MIHAPAAFRAMFFSSDCVGAEWDGHPEVHVDIPGWLEYKTNMRARRCLLVFSRAPRHEAVAKGLAGATALFEMGLQRVRAAAARLPGVDLIEPSQRGDGFGERLLNAFRDARALGYRDIVAVPCDAPGLGPRQIAAAFAALTRHTVALGPSPDGGVYLIGISDRVDLEDLLGSIRWRTRHVTADLVAKAPRAALLGEPIADVDGRADLVALRRTVLDPILAALVRAILATPGHAARPAARVVLTPACCRSLTDRSPPAAFAVL